MPQLTEILSELHRRSIWQVISGYGVGAWLVLQLAETLSSLLGLPLWFGPAVIGLLVAGLPLVVLTSVVQGGRIGQPRAPEGRQEAAAVTGDLQTPGTPAPEPSPDAAGSGSLDTRDVGPGESPDPGLVRTSAQRVFTWSNAFIGAGIGIGLLGATTGGYLGMRQMGVGPVATLQAQGLIGDEERVILAEFDDRTGDPSLAQTVTALVRIDLSQSAAIRVLEPTDMAPVLRRMERPAETEVTFDVAREIAQREGIKAVIGGEVLPLGSGFVVAIRLVAVPSGDVLVAERESAGDAEDIAEAVDRLSAQLRERIGESLRAIQGDPPLAEVTTRSLEALQRYAQGVRANDQGDYARATALLGQALAADSTFAMAHRKLGIVLSNRNQDPERWRRSFELAYEFRDRLTDRERLLAEAAYHSYVTQDDGAAIRAYESLLARYPNDPTALNNLGIAYSLEGRDRDAEAMYLRAIDSGSASTVAYSNVATLQFRLGMVERAESTVVRLAEQYPDYPGALALEARLAAAQFAHDRAAELTEELVRVAEGNGSWEATADFALSAIHMLGGRPEAATRAMVDALVSSERIGLGLLTGPLELFEAQLRAAADLDFRSDTASAIAILDRATTGASWDSVPSGQRDASGFATLYALAGRVDRATELLTEGEQGGPSEPEPTTLSGISASFARAAIAMAEGRYDDAVVGFRAAGPTDGCPICGLREIGDAWLAAGVPDSAIVAFRAYLETPMLERASSDGVSLWRVRLGLGQAYEATGQPERAIEEYQRFLDQWTDPEPDVRHHLVAARAAIERLRAGLGAGSSG